MYNRTFYLFCLMGILFPAAIIATVPSAFSNIASTASTSSCPTSVAGYCAKTTPVINFVSTDKLTQSDAYRTGSPVGGAVLYLKGTGLSSDYSASTVLINGQACTVQPSYTSVLQIGCTVPASNTLGNLTITVTINGQAATCDPSICYFRYNITTTPILSHICPHTISGNQNISFGGNFRSKSSNDFTFNMNNYLCDFGKTGVQNFDSSDSDNDGFGFAKCNVGQLPAGVYNVSLNVQGKGKCCHHNTAFNKPDDLGRLNNLTILPSIISISSNNGTTSGESLVITGTGFSSLASENEIYHQGVPCKITSCSYSQIKCDLLNPKVSPVKAQPGHCGLRQRTFTVNDCLDSVKNSAEFKSKQCHKSQCLSAETEHGRIGSFSESVEGYFLATVNGTYKFLLSSDGPAQLYFSKTPLVTTNLVKIAEVYAGTNFRDFYSHDEVNQTSEGIPLVAGQHYFIQAIHILNNTGHMTLGVIVPSKTKEYNSLRKVVAVTVNAEVVKQTAVLTIKSLPILSTLIQLGTYINSKLVKSDGFNFPGKAEHVEASMLALGTPCKVLKRTTYDLFGRETKIDLLAATVIYNIQMTNTSSLTLSTKPSCFPPTYINFALDNAPTSLVNGYFNLGCRGKALKVNFNHTADQFRDALLNIPGIGIPRVTSYGDCHSGNKWIVQFDGNTDSLASLALTSLGTLSGGKSGSLNVSVDVLQDDSVNDTLYVPIPHNMLFTAEEYAQITIKTSGFPASCPGCNCNYHVTPATVAPTISSFSLSQDILIIFLSNANTLTLRSLSVSFATIDCTIVSWDSVTQKITAKLPPNNSNKPTCVAGVHQPVVKINGTIILNLDSGVTGLKVLPTITSITPSLTSASSGFLNFYINGTGFGYSLVNNYTTTITVGGLACELKALANDWALCSSNKVFTSGPLNITVNNLTASFPV